MTSMQITYIRCLMVENKRSCSNYRIIIGNPYSIKILFDIFRIIFFASYCCYQQQYR